MAIGNNHPIDPGRSRGGTSVVLLVSLVAGLAIARTVSAQDDLGPMGSSEQNPVYRFLYVPTSDAADVLLPGSLRVDFTTQYSSVFEESYSNEHNEIVDLEQMTNSLGIRYGASPSFEIGARITLSTGWDGFLDPFLNGFHHILGLPDGGRQGSPEDRYRFELERDGVPGDRVDIELGKRTMQLEDVRITGKWLFYDSEDRTKAVSLATTVRAAGGPFDGGRLSGGLRLNGRVSIRRFHLHSTLALAALNPPTELNPIAKSMAGFLSGTVEHVVGPRLHLLAEVVTSTPYFEGFEQSDVTGIPMTLSLGLAGRFGAGWTWRTSFAEDILFGGPSVDFTLGLEVTRTFPVTARR